VGKKIRENRYFRRYIKKLSAKVSDGKNSHAVEILDYSLDGIGVMLRNNVPISKGDVLNVDNDELSIHGDCEVEWASVTPSGLRLGLHKLTPLSGSLANFRLADILIGLQRSLKNGTLRIASGPVEKNIYLKNGDIIFARSNQKHERLGDILLREGRITQAAYDITTKLISMTGKMQGALLVEIKALEAKDLAWAVQHQVEEILLDLFTLSGGTFEFHENVLPAEKIIRLKLPSGQIIYRGLKKTECIEQLKDYLNLPSETIIAFSLNPLDLFQDISFDEEDKKILSCIDGKRNIQDLENLSGLAEATVRRSLSALMSTAIIEPVDRQIPEGGAPFEYIISRSEPPPGLVDSIEELQRKCPALDYYSLLGVADSATDGELRTAFYCIAKEYHPDRHFYLDEDIKGKLHNIYAHLIKAYNVLSSREKRTAYDRSLSGKQPGIPRTELARNKFNEGHTHYINGNLDEAAKDFREALYLDKAEAMYHFFHGLVLRDGNRLKDAERAVARACKIAPENDEYNAELGHIYIRLGLLLRAKISFMKALQINKTNRRAQEGLLSLQ
jgi:curved DNA-binding protein CbpA